ncbi:MAG: hemolysin family protein [Pseudomonadota bacterium]
MGDSTDAPAENDDPQAPSPKGGMTLFDRVFRRRPRPVDTPESFGTAEDIAAAKEGASEMLVNVRRMRDMRVEDVAVPRADIVAVPDTSDLDELVAVFKESTLTRLPVFRETLDNPLGLVHLKDVALAHGFGPEAGGFDLNNLIRPLIYAPPSMPMGVLLAQMQSARGHMALVIDEYGGVDGLVTLEDIVEQIVGEIADEHDADESDLWTEEAPDCYLAYSRAPLDEFESAAHAGLRTDDLDEDVDTLGGLVFILAGRVPARGELVRHPLGHEFEVIDADPRRVKRLRVRVARDNALTQAAE